MPQRIEKNRQLWATVVAICDTDEPAPWTPSMRGGTLSKRRQLRMGCGL